MEVFKGGCLKHRIQPILRFFLEFFSPLPDTTTPWMRLWFSGIMKVVSEGDYCSNGVAILSGFHDIPQYEACQVEWCPIGGHFEFYWLEIIQDASSPETLQFVL